MPQPAAPFSSALNLLPQGPHVNSPTPPFGSVNNAPIHWGERRAYHPGWPRRDSCRVFGKRPLLVLISATTCVEDHGVDATARGTTPSLEAPPMPPLPGG